MAGGTRRGTAGYTNTLRFSFMFTLSYMCYGSHRVRVQKACFDFPLQFVLSIKSVSKMICQHSFISSLSELTPLELQGS